MMEPVELIKRDPRVQQNKDWATTGWTDKSRKRAVVNSLYIESEALEELNVRLQRRYAQIKKKETMFEAYNTENAEIIVYAYGTVARIVKSAIKKCAEAGVKVGLARPITLWPFPDKAVHEAAAQKSVVGLLTVEMSAGQMVEDVRLAVNGIKPVDFMGKLGASLPTTEEIVDKILQVRKERG
jgi:2-oxoglutarate ferredoxin oxidoreductase subunit alpha